MYPLTETGYEALLRRLTDEHGISSTLNRRNAMEQEYFLHHKARGVKLRAKYRRR